MGTKAKKNKPKNEAKDLPVKVVNRRTGKGNSKRGVAVATSNIMNKILTRHGLVKESKSLGKAVNKDVRQGRKITKAKAARKKK